MAGRSHTRTKRKNKHREKLKRERAPIDMLRRRYLSPEGKKLLREDRERKAKQFSPSQD